MLTVTANSDIVDLTTSLRLSSAPVVVDRRESIERLWPAGDERQPGEEPVWEIYNVCDLCWGELFGNCRVEGCPGIFWTGDHHRPCVHFWDDSCFSRRWTFNSTMERHGAKTDVGSVSPVLSERAVMYGLDPWRYVDLEYGDSDTGFTQLTWHIGVVQRNIRALIKHLRDVEDLPVKIQERLTLLE